MARLLVSFQGAEFAFDLRGDAVRIGSAPTNGLVLRDQGVSQEHAEVRRQGEVWRLIDLESAAGTRVNGLYVNKQDLKDGDVVSVGAAKLTFKEESGVAPAPMPSSAPSAAPIPAPAPIPGSWGAPAPVAVAPVPMPVPGAGAARRPQGRDRDRDDDRGRRRPARRGGSAAGAVFVLVIAAVGVAAIAYLVTPKDDKKADPNPMILAQMNALIEAGRFGEAAELESKGNPKFDHTMGEIHRAARSARNRAEGARSEGIAAEGDAYWKERIAPRLPASESDARDAARACEEFCAKFPGHARFDEAGLIHIQLTAEASPSWQKAKGGSNPGQGGHLGVADLIRAAEARVGPFLKNGNYAAAFRVYDMFSDACDRIYASGYRVKFDKEAEAPRYLIKKQATAEFERLEEKAMTMEDARRYDEVEALYRDARERFGLPDVKERCNAELERLRDRKR